MEQHEPHDFPVSTRYEYDVMLVGSMTHFVRGCMIREFRELLGPKSHSPKWRTGGRSTKRPSLSVPQEDSGPVLFD